MQIHRIYRQIDVHHIQHLDFQNALNARDMNIGSVNRDPHVRRPIYHQRAHQIRRSLRSGGIVNKRPEKSLELPVVIIRRDEQNRDQSEYYEYQNTGADAPDVSGTAYLPVFSYDSSSFHISSSCFSQFGHFDPVSSTSGILSVPCPKIQMYSVRGWPNRSMLDHDPVTTGILIRRRQVR